MPSKFSQAKFNNLMTNTELTHDTEHGISVSMERNIGRKHLLGMTGYDDMITMIHSSIMCNITSHDTSDQVPLTSDQGGSL